MLDEVRIQISSATPDLGYEYVLWLTMFSFMSVSLVSLIIHTKKIIAGSVD